MTRKLAGTLRHDRENCQELSVMTGKLSGTLCPDQENCQELSVLTRKLSQTLCHDQENRQEFSVMTRKLSGTSCDKRENFRSSCYYQGTVRKGLRKKMSGNTTFPTNCGCKMRNFFGTWHQAKNYDFQNR